MQKKDMPRKISFTSAGSIVFACRSNQEQTDYQQHAVFYAAALMAHHEPSVLQMHQHNTCYQFNHKSNAYDFPEQANGKQSAADNIKQGDAPCQYIARRKSFAVEELAKTM